MNLFEEHLAGRDDLARSLEYTTRGLEIFMNRVISQDRVIAEAFNVLQGQKAEIAKLHASGAEFRAWRDEQAYNRNVALASIAPNNALVPMEVCDTPSPQNAAFIEEEDPQPVASSSKNVG